MNNSDFFHIPEELLSFYSETYLSWDYWEEIRQCKKKFIEKGIDPRNNRHIRPEVANSWIRSRNYGLNPYQCLNVYSLNEIEYEKVKKKNSLLIEVATPLINNFLLLAASSGFTLGLFDPDGLFLSGSKLNINSSDTIMLNERTVGTTSHGLAMLHKKPIRLIGPEEYLEAYHDIISYSAPILDDNGEVLGALALRHNVCNKLLEHNFNKLQVHSLGWISSLAIAIAGQISLRKINENIKSINENIRNINERLEKTNKILEVTLECIDEGIITIDPDGTIIRANQKGKKILHFNPEAREDPNILKYLDNPSTLLKILRKQENVNYIEELVRTKQGEKSYLISVQPVIKPGDAKLEAAVLRFSCPEKINALTASRNGATAKFTFNDIIGISQCMVNSKSVACRFASSPQNILLLGESGTGKELFAQAIHNHCRPRGPFIAVNCAAMPRNLIESELFGYERGAFTGAEKNGCPGKIELANGGTLFLDEIGDMPYELQAVLLRVLEDKQVMRLGGKRSQQVDFRLIAATNQNLLELVEKKLFREDLYFRLSVFTVEIPPLRERGHDKILLAEYFVRHYARQMGWPVPTISPEVQKKILQYNWPGNVRQLENVMIYSVNLAENAVIELQHLPKDIFRNKQIPNTKYRTSVYSLENLFDKDISMKEYEKLIILHSLKRTNNNVAKAAGLLGISQSSIYRKIRQYAIDY